jgi:hypothetical protein
VIGDDSISALLERHYLKLAHGWNVTIRRIDMTEDNEIIIDIDVTPETAYLAGIGIILVVLVALGACGWLFKLAFLAGG